VEDEPVANDDSVSDLLTRHRSNPKTTSGEKRVSQVSILTPIAFASSSS